MIARGDYWDLLTHYGLQSVVIFIVVLLGLHLFHEYMTLYFRRKYHPEEFTEKDDEDKD